jgi:hypothetical protein
MAKKPRIYATIGPFVFAYPHITSPDSEGKYADNKYKVDAVADPKSKAMVQAQDIVQNALKEFGLPKKGTNLPIKRETEKDENGKKTETGKLVLKAKSQYAPVVVDAKGNPIPEKALKKLKIGAGSEGLIEGFFAPYTTTEKVRNADGELETVETQGINFTLTGVQLVKLVKGGQGGSSFGAYEGGGFSYDGDDEDEDDNTSGGLDLDTDDDEDDEGGLDI